MVFVLGLAVALWAIGLLLGYSQSKRLLAIAGLLIVVIVLNLLLPFEHPLRVATGQSPKGWSIVLALGILIWLYATGVRRLKKSAQTEQPSDTPPPLFTETELERYARHIMLREIGGPGQKALKEAKVLVIGAGGLGAPALSYLGAMGVGTIGVIDDDKVENSNLQRQVIHTDDRIGMDKVQSAKLAVEAQNPYVTVRPYARRLTEEIAAELFADYDIILDGTDNFDTRYLSNKAAAEAGKPLVSGALAQWEGQISVFDPANGSPCYKCVFPDPPAPGLVPSCAEAGVSAALPGVIGAMMAQEAMKLIIKEGQPLRGEMVLYDALYGDFRKIKLHRNPDCPVCQGADKA